MIKESCSCGASFEMEDLRWTQPEWADKGKTVEQQEVAIWRANHRHDPKIHYLPAPTVPGIYPTSPTWITNEVPPPPDPVAQPGYVR